MKEPIKRSHTLWDWIYFKIMEKYGGEEFFAIFDNEEPTLLDNWNIDKVESSKWWKKRVLEVSHSQEEYDKFKDSIRAELQPYLRKQFDNTFQWISLDIWPRTDYKLK